MSLGMVVRRCSGNSRRGKPGSSKRWKSFPRPAETCLIRRDPHRLMSTTDSSSEPVSLAPLQPRPGISHVVFDFDGTLSWLRHGWPEFMCDVFCEQIKPGEAESASDLRSMLLGEIVALNGQPSIYQCQRFVDILAARGGPRLEAE